jgi:hypothetical protein
MGRRIEDMGTMTAEVVATTVNGYSASAGKGSLAPKGFGGHVVVAITTDTADDSIEVTLETAVLGITAIDLGMNYRGVADTSVALTTADGGQKFTGTDADMSALIALAAAAGDDSTRNYPGIEIYFQCYDATVDLDDASDPATDLHQKTTEHGGWNSTPVHEEGGLVRVGRLPANPVAYPDHRGGWDSANLSGDKYPTLPGQPSAPGE